MRLERCSTMAFEQSGAVVRGEWIGHSARISNHFRFLTIHWLPDWTSRGLFLTYCLLCSQSSGCLIRTAFFSRDPLPMDAHRGIGSHGPCRLFRHTPCTSLRRILSQVFISILRGSCACKFSGFPCSRVLHRTRILLHRLRLLVLTLIKLSLPAAQMRSFV